MIFYDIQKYCGIVDMKVVVVGICTKLYKSLDYSNNVVNIKPKNSCDIRFISQYQTVNRSLWICPFYFLKSHFSLK
jgi:hypothetical protein